MGQMQMNTKTVGFLLLAGLGAAMEAQAAPDRIAGAVDPARISVLRGQVHPLAQSRYDQGLADPSLQLRSVTVYLQPAPGLEEFLAGKPPGRWLQPEEFAGRFGLSQNDLGKVTGWLTSQGLQVDMVARGRHWIGFSGTAEQISRALHTEIHRYLVNGKMHFANATEPAIPQALQGVIAGFRGLHDFLPSPPARPVAKATPDFSSGGYHYLAPGDLATIYDLTPLYNQKITGTGQTIVVVGQSDLMASDISLYRELYSLPATVPLQLLSGPDPGTNAALIEADLDLELAGAVAPDASLVYVNSFDFLDALQYAVDQNLGQVISVSYGFCEALAYSYFRSVVQQANAQGITVVAAAGDAGAAQCDRGDPTPQASTGYAVSWPASLPEVTAVGGTEFNDSGGLYWTVRNNANGGSALSYIPETPWNDTAAVNQLAAGGGGPSVLYPKPTWQNGPGVPNDSARDLPDISFSASGYHDPYLFVFEGLSLVEGGTSASTPVFAGIVALLNQYQFSQGTIGVPGLGNINASLYAMAQSTPNAFHDVTTGNTDVPCAQSTPGCVNGMLGFNAGPGYDLATGLGSLDVFNFVTQWTGGSAPQVSLTLSPATAAPTDTVQLTATVKGAGATPSGSIAFMIQAGGGIGPLTLANVNLAAGTTAGTATATLTATGAQLGIGGGSAVAMYSGDAVYQAAQASASFTLKLGTVTGSMALPFVTPNPVPESGDGIWQYMVGLTEVAGVGTTLTGFTINGVKQNLAFWTGTNIPANGTVYAQLGTSGLTAPLNRVFVFSGMDAGGQTWTQQISVPFLSNATANTPNINLTTATPTVPQTSSTNCPWPIQLSVEETGGYEDLLQNLLVNGAKLNSEIQTTFGTTRLAPYGLLQGNLCFTAPGTVTIELTGVSDSGEVGRLVFGLANATLQPAPSAPLPPWTAPAAGASYSFNAANSSATPAPIAIPVSFSTGSPGWTMSAGPVNPATGWLTVAPVSGTGAGSVTVSAAPAGLSPGAYTAVLTFASLGASPQVVNVTVTLTVGASNSLSIAGLVNNFSGGLMAAPGMMTGVYGSNMAPAGTSLTAPGLPLPLTLGGVSATVNGVTAPLYFVSPGQIDLQIPYETSAGTAVLAIDNNGQIATFAFQVAVTAPGLFPSAIDISTGLTTPSATLGQTLLLFMTGDGDVTPTLATGATPFPTSNPNNYPQPRLPLTVTVGGVPAQVLFQAIPFRLAGATQINFTIPSGAPSGAQQVVVTVGGVAAPPVNLTIGTP